MPITGSLENSIGSLVYELGKFVFLVSVILILFFCTYVRVSNKLYDNQIEQRRELGEFIENPFRIGIGKPNKSIRYQDNNSGGLEVHNKTPSKQIADCQVRLDIVVNAKNNRSVPGIDQQYLLWNDL